MQKFPPPHMIHAPLESTRFSNVVAVFRADGSGSSDLNLLSQDV